MKKILTIAGCVLGGLAMTIGIVTKIKQSAAISIIGGADGPTSVFLAGKIGNDYSWTMILIGAVLLIGSGIFYYITHKRK